MSQVNEILNYMYEEGRISTWIAYERFRCTTLAQRIADLKKKRIILDGQEYEIKDELINRNGKTYSEYFLIPSEPQIKMRF